MKYATTWAKHEHGSSAPDPVQPTGDWVWRLHTVSIVPIVEWIGNSPVGTTGTFIYWTWERNPG